VFTFSFGMRLATLPCSILPESAWMAQASLHQDAFLFPSRLHGSLHLSTRQYARIVDQWIVDIPLDVAAYGTHTMRQTNAT
jgi:hypothetical protein